MTTPLMLAIADIGYTEYPPNSNKTKYGVWYGLNGVPYCMEAVQYWYDKAGYPLPYKTASCSDLLAWYKKHQPDKIVKMPLPEDIVIYKFGHTGIVEGGNSQAVTAVEANTSPTAAGSQDNGGGVYRRTRSASLVEAYIRPYNFTKKDDYMTKDEILKELGDKWIARYSDLPEWAKPDVRWMLDNGIINGGTDYNVDPDDINMFLSDIKNNVVSLRIIKALMK